MTSNESAKCVTLVKSKTNLKCQFYNEHRNQLLSGLNATVLNLNNSEKLKLLLSEHPRKTARYLVQSLAKRKNNLYLNN